MVGLYNLGTPANGAPRKRNVFFSFHYADIMRVNNVRLCGEFKGSSPADVLYGPTKRSIEGFYDKSLWESRKLDGPDALKNLIRDGVKNTSVVCLLVGSHSYSRRWVRYEVARSVIDGKGLVAIHINSIRHHQPPYAAHARGTNPAFCMGIAKRDNGNFYLCELNFLNGSWVWHWYTDYISAVPIPRYMRAPELNNPLRLSDFTREYDWSQGGHNNIGSWLDMAAQDAGR